MQIDSSTARIVQSNNQRVLSTISDDPVLFELHRLCRSVVSSLRSYCSTYCTRS